MDRNPTGKQSDVHNPMIKNTLKKGQNLKKDEVRFNPALGQKVNRSSGHQVISVTATKQR